MLFVLLFPSSFVVVYDDADDDDDDDEKTTLFNIMCAENTNTREFLAMKSEESASRAVAGFLKYEKIEKSKKMEKKSLVALHSFFRKRERDKQK